MSKTKPARPRTDVPLPPAASTTSVEHDMGRTIRETIESIVIAFVLAFLFRTFEAEAFVIPTGSMAPTLQGRHKDLHCEQCGYRIRASASDEDKAAELSDPRERERAIRETAVVAVTCPMCRYRTPVEGDDPSFNGDRILVAKFPFDFIDPRRWDIVVFKYPNDAKTNYIKRLIGLPNETVRIYHGDIFTRETGAEDSSPWQIQRKPPEKLLAMAQIVYDDNFVSPELKEKGWLPRWQNVPDSDSSTGAWKASDDGRQFEIASSKSPGPVWLRYRHLPPTQNEWTELEDGSRPADEPVRPQLITDFYAYNNGISRGSQRADGSLALNWVGDLMVEAMAELQNDQGQLLLDLVEGGVHFRATFEVATGEVELSIDGVPNFAPKATTAVKGQGTYRLQFANFDDELLLWVNGSLVTFDQPTTYGPLNNDQPRSTAADPGDLAPVGIGVEGGLAATVRDLKVKRDIYYIADKYGSRELGGLSEYEAGTQVPFMSADQLARFFADPEAWRRAGSNGRNAFELRREVQFPMEEDQFFVLGDNSPASADSRLWKGDHFVSREMMIGKALFIYWPHGLYHIPGTGIPFPYGMFPNVRDMGFVR